MKKCMDLLTVLLFCVFLAVFALLFWILPDRAFSETENRSLASCPEWNAERVANGSFSSEMNAYYADQFPFRDGFVRIKSLTELAFGKGENNGVLYSENQLAVRSFDAYATRLLTTRDCDRFYEATVKAQLERVNAFAEKTDLPVLTLIPPRTVDVAESAFSYRRPDGDRLFELCAETLSDKAGYLPLPDDLRLAYEDGAYVIYRTDHHWTTLGAYIAYEKIASSLGFAPTPLDAFAQTTVEDFSGTTAARASFPFYKKDTVTLYSNEFLSSLQVTADGVHAELYDLSKAQTADKYAVFLGGTHGVTEIFGKAERKTLLIAKDSFADSLIPFLAMQYDIVALDLKTHPDLTSAAETYHADAVLIVWNAENLISNAYLGNIR